MSWPTLKELADDVKSGKTTAVELVEKSLKTIKDNEEYNAIISVMDDAMARAKEIDKGDKKGALCGIPFIAKDNYLAEGTITTAASNILGNYKAPYSGTALKKLEAEGAILVAKANLDSFAHGSSTENSDMGPTLNPVDKTRVPGGSSGGSAAAVVLQMAPFALGTDTGGSIRLPASYTGCVGYKPTYGLISRYGVVAMASSTDVLGPITNTVEDSAYLVEIMAGRDSLDSTTIERDEHSYLVDESSELKGKTIGVVKEFMGEGVEPAVQKAMDETIELARKAGAQVKEVSIANIDKALAVYYIVMPAEVSSNLSRYDGIRYGHSTDKAENLNEVYENSRTEGFNDEVKRRIMIGTYVLSSGYYDAYYKKAQAVRTILINEMNKAFEEVDFLVGPTAPSTAFKLGENTDDPLKMYLSDIMTVATNLVGIPGISIPCAKDSDGLPIGFQIQAPQRHDRDLLNFSAALEREIGYVA